MNTFTKTNNQEMRYSRLFSFVIVVALVTFFQKDSKAQVFNPVANCIQDASTGECLPNTLLTAVPFLRIVPDARSGAMGDAGIAIAPDANSLHFNGSNLAFVEDNFSLSATYTPWLRELGLTDVYLAYLSGYKKVDDLSTLGFALRFFSLGDINFTDINGNPTGMGRPREFELSAGYARKLSENFSAGLTAKYIYSNLASGQLVGGIPISTGNSFAADISFSYRTEVGSNNDEFAFGVALSNIGSKISYTNNNLKDFLPGNLGLGAAYTLNMDEYNSLTFALDINKLLVPTPQPFRILDENGMTIDNPEFDADNSGVADYRETSTFSGIFGSFADAPGGFSEELKEFSFSLGAEYWYNNQFAVRAGYYHENPLKGDRNYLTLGIGLKYNVAGINLSYLVPTSSRRSPLDNTLRFSFIFDTAVFDAR